MPTTLPDHFVTAQTLAPEEHVRMQAALQQRVDSAIRKTVNLPADISFDDFKQVYSGCKGCTTYRPNAITGSILSTEPLPASSAPLAPITSSAPPPDKLERHKELTGRTYKLKWVDAPHAFYVTINDADENGRLRPFEVFISSANMEHSAWAVALTRMISAVFRRGGDVAFVAEELKAIFDPRGGQWLDGRYVPSLIAAIGGITERHMIATGFMTAPERLAHEDDDTASVASLAGRIGMLCPRCSQPRVVK